MTSIRAMKTKLPKALPNNDPITSRDLKDYLLTRDDFALELEVYRVAKANGFTASHGGTYVDPVTDKPRQYDVRAQLEVNGMRLMLAIECKCLRPAYPLLVSRVPRTDRESFIDYVCQDKSSIPGMPKIPPAQAVRISPHSIYPAYERVGKSMTQVGRNGAGELTGGDSDVYDKWMQALASAAGLVSDAAYDHSVAATAVLPILVVANETLWVADYLEDGSLHGEPTQTDACTLFVGREYDGFGFTISHLRVFTAAGLKIFLYDLTRDTGQWEALFPRKRIGEKLFPHLRKAEA